MAKPLLPAFLFPVGAAAQYFISDQGIITRRSMIANT
ncbi:DUF1705 domain-containing protein [Salmonella enterica subsp. enterica]|nr:DUF1705 domain-containing protein [Salmonella enterica subsp. enterica]